MKRVGVAALLLTVAFTGCLALNDYGSPSDSPDEELPPRPEQLNRSTAESYALEYERVVLRDRLERRYDSYGLGCCTAPKFSSVVVEDSGVYYVRVKYPYHYRNGNGEADGATYAMYAISDGETMRITLDYRYISPEDTYSATNHTENGQAPYFYFVNPGNSERELSLELVHLERDETAFTREFPLGPDTGLELSSIASRKGTYRLTVASEHNVTRYRFTIDESLAGEVFVIYDGNEPVIRDVPDTPNRTTSQSTSLPLV